MGQFKGTKGKWSMNLTFYSSKDLFIPIKSNVENRGWIADCKGSHVNEGMKTEEMKANALLISKAPEMLEMLVEIRNQIEDGRTYITKDDINKLIKSATEL